MNIQIHFFIGIPGPTLDSTTKKLLKQVHPGGIILFGRNIKSPEQLSHLTQELRRILGSHLLICIDHEGGRVNRLKDLIGIVPSAMQLGFLGKIEWAYQHGTLTGRLLREFGININLAPVLDLWLRPKTDNSVPDRCWSKKPEIAARLAGAFLKGMQTEGVIGCGKHFLGYGAADKDPHRVLPFVTRTREEILSQDLMPYARLLPKNSKTFSKQGLNLIMLSHAHLQAFHGEELTPACISSLITQKILRDHLQFRGTTITDDLEMGAITRTLSIGTATIQCLQLGVDLILICHTAKAIREGYTAAQNAAKQGLFAPKILSDSEKRILHLQKQAKFSEKFSLNRFEALRNDLKNFTRKIFKAVPPALRVIDERWGPIGEKY